MSERCVFLRSSFRASSAYFVRRIVSREALIFSAVSLALTDSSSRRIVSSARSASS